MKLGVSAFAWTSKFEGRHLGLIPKVKEMGFNGFEIAMFDPADLAVPEIRRAFEASELECTVCAILPSDINPISPDRATRFRSIEHLRRCIDAASRMGAKVLGGPLYAPIGYLPDHRPTNDEWAWAVETFHSVEAELDSCGVTLCIEPVNRSETFFIRTACEAKALCEVLGNSHIGVTIDTFHANIEEKNVANAIASLGPHLKHLHASENDRGRLGDGHVDFRAILSVLFEIGYDGYLMIEGFGYTPDEKSSPGTLWAEQSVSPEEIAAKGKYFLDGLLHPAAQSTVGTLQ